MEFLQVLKHELNYHWCNEINTVNYDTNMTSTFRSFDRNGSNYIELGEFIVGALFICKMFTIEECVLVFNTFIKADPRRISLDEFRANMRIEMDPKRYVKIHNWFEAIIGCKVDNKNNGLSGLISIDHFIQYFMKTDNVIPL